MSTNLQNDMLSYASVLNSIKKFKQSGTVSGGDFNYFDTPSHQYFKICFYFINGDKDGNDPNELNSGGLLSPTWQIPDLEEEDLYNYTSAWSYLKLNDEQERADKLKYFVELLSNINTESPWYFNSIEGLDVALERKQTMEEQFKFDEQRKKITIKCLPDAYDNRIGTLLDLYKEITWSWQMKRAVLPPNLRKFDMGIYIFESPISNIIKKPGGMITLGPKENNIDAIFHESSDDKAYTTSYKYIEFHNCEFDYNNFKTAYSTLNNGADGVQPTYSIDIHFDDCYETRYNEFMMQTIGDMISLDSIRTIFEVVDGYADHIAGMTGYKIPTRNDNIVDMNSDTPVSRTNSNFVNGELYNRVFVESGILTNALSQVISTGANWVKGKVASVVLGNLYKTGISKIASQVGSLLNGDVMTTAHNISSYINNANKEPKRREDLGSIDKHNNHRPSPQYVKDMGNIFKGASIVSNL